MAAAPTEALRVRRRGRWLSWTADGLDADVARLAEGWRAAGVQAGSTITAVGPLSAPFVLSLKAAALIGARVQPLALLSDAALPPDVPLAHVLVDGTHELEALLARRPVGLGQVFIAHPLRAEIADAAPGLHLRPFADLLDSGSASTGVSRAGARAPNAGSRVLAEFEPHWAPGLHWLQHAWASRAATLVIPEPGGDAWADRRQARPDLWLAPAGTLEAAALDIGPRARRAPAWLLRWRAASVLGLRPGLQLVTDGPLSRDAAAVFEALGASPARAHEAPAWSPQLLGTSA
jgi:hypothetical protein